MFNQENKIIYNKNNPEKPSKTKAVKHILYGYTVLKIWTFDDIENKHDIYGVKGCMKILFETP